MVSTSSIQESYKYDVFLSFRGEDTRKNFIDHLYYALQQKNIYTYKDDEIIKKGKTISDELNKAIEESKFYIIVFSKNYASSSSCLNELVKIMECQKTTKHTAYPIFYDVEPCEVRTQSVKVRKPFSNHKFREVSMKWKAALKEAADLAGWDLKNIANGHEAKVIQKIVEDISLELHPVEDISPELHPIESTTNKVKSKGVESRIKGIVSLVQTGFDNVGKKGIKGIGGDWKINLGGAAFDQISVKLKVKPVLFHRN